MRPTPPAALAAWGLLAAAVPLAAGGAVDENSSDDAIRRFAFVEPVPPRSEGRNRWMNDPTARPEQAFADVAAAATLDEARAIVAAGGYEVLSERAEPWLYRFRVRRWGYEDERLVWRRDFYEPARGANFVFHWPPGGRVQAGRLGAPAIRANVVQLAGILWSQAYGDWVQARLLSERIHEDGDVIRILRFTTVGIEWDVKVWRWRLECDRRDGTVTIEASVEREIRPPCVARRAGEALHLQVEVDPTVLVPRSVDREPPHRATVRVTLRNATDDDLYLTFPDPCFLRYRLETPAGETAPSEAEALGCIQPLGLLHLQPRGARTQEFAWTGRDWDGTTPLAPGPYRIVGTLAKRYCRTGENEVREDPPLRSAPVAVEVRPAAP